MNIAYLILAHVDPEHISRLAYKLSRQEGSFVYIHVDKKTDIEPFKKLINHKDSIHFIENRTNVSWAGFSSVTATLSLIENALSHKKYDRLILLQGLDYPLYSNEQILDFFKRNKEVEFIRACKVTDANNRLIASKVEKYWFFENRNFIKRSVNKINAVVPFKMRKGYILEDKRYDLYWGTAQWAITGDCAEFILDFSKNHTKFNKYLKTIHAPDESYFHSIIYNSHFAEKTVHKSAEIEHQDLVNWRNLHYFEYPNQIRIFNENDFDLLMNIDSMFIRKVNSEESTRLLDMLDELEFASQY